MCQRTDSEDIAETEFCLNPNEREENKVIHQGWLTAPLIKINPNEHRPNERMAEEGENKITRILGESEAGREWVMMKKYVEDGEDEKVEEWLDRGIQEVKTEQEGVNGSHGEPERRSCSCMIETGVPHKVLISAANRWQSLTMALRKSKSQASGFFNQVALPNTMPNEEVKKVKMDFMRFLELRPKPAADGKCGALRMSDVCK